MCVYVCVCLCAPSCLSTNSYTCLIPHICMLAHTWYLLTACLVSIFFLFLFDFPSWFDVFICECIKLTSYPEHVISNYPFQPLPTAMGHLPALSSTSIFIYSPNYLFPFYYPPSLTILLFFFLLLHLSSTYIS